MTCRVMFLLLFSIGILQAESELKPKISVAEKLISESSFEKKVSRTKKGMMDKNWKASNGVWRVEDGILIGSQAKGQNHAATLSHVIKAGDLIFKAQIKFNAAQQIDFSFRDTVPPMNHIGRLNISKKRMSLMQMSGLGPSTKVKGLKSYPLKLDSKKWYDVLVEVIGDQVYAQVGKHQITATHRRFKVNKAFAVFVVKGQGAEFRNISLWHAKPK